MVNTKKTKPNKKTKSTLVVSLLGGFVNLENLKDTGYTVVFNAQGKGGGKAVFITLKKLIDLVDDLKQVVKLKGGSNAKR